MKLSDGWIFTPRQDAKNRLIIMVEQSELVRCRNCKYYNTECYVEGCGWCCRRDFGTTDEWYCADGERADAPACDVINAGTEVVKVKLVDADADADALCEYANNQKDKSIDANDIMRFPIINVAPIGHGRWVKMTGMMPPEYHGHYECSECGWHMKGLRNSWTREEEMPYCPHCGAKMDGSEDDENV